MSPKTELAERPFEERAAEVKRFFDYFAIEGEVRPLEAELLKSVLTELGARFESLDEEGRRSLAHYSNKGKHLGMGQVWGPKSKLFRETAERWALGYEIEEHTELPTINFAGGPSKTEGMRALFGELTAYAAGSLSFEDFAVRLRARYLNFNKPEEERIRITIPGYNLNDAGKEKAFAPASFPPEFPQDAWKIIMSWKPRWP